jgi:Na+-transporting NADH:ubiquinone oxidoreductase subunit A
MSTCLFSWKNETPPLSLQIRTKKGLNIPLAGEPEQSVHPGPEIQNLALCGPDYVGLKPRLLVSEGDPVALGQPLFIDKRDPAVSYCSPGQGTVAAINRGARRALESVVVRLAYSGPDDVRFDPLGDEQVETLDRELVVGRLQQSGLWTAFRTRPFSRVPFSDSSPGSIFVTAIDTRPLAADPGLVAGQDSGAFVSGLRVLPLLTAGAVYLCTGPGWDIQIPQIERLEMVEFSGPHPAGLPGTHIHHLDPAGADRVAWHIAYQDVIAIGKLFTSGSIHTTRIIALGGDCLERPRLLTTRLGASIDELVDGEIGQPDDCRVISGSVLGGRTAIGGVAFLGRYHDQVSVIREGGDKHLFGWTGLFPRRYTTAKAGLADRGQRKKQSFSTSQNGRFTGMIPLRVFEQVMPLDILPAPLFRALMVKDTDRAQALGCLELDEEDLALSSFVCPAKYDYGKVLRINLDQIEREG